MLTRTCASLLALLVLPGCMSDREYQLRARQLENQAMHPATYDLFTVEGPIRIDLAAGGKAQVTVPGQPFREIAIPDGVSTQADLVRHLSQLGLVGALGWKALDQAGGDVSTTSTTTTNNGGTP